MATLRQPTSRPDASRRSPTDSALRANPFPEVTDPFCRLPLPTLFVCTKNESIEVQTLGVIRIQLIYSINILSKYSSLISHRPSIFEGRPSIIDLRRSTHRSPKVDTSIFEGQHIDLRRSTHRDIDRRSSKGDTSIFESRHIDLRKWPHRFSKIEGRNITPTIRHRILSTTALQVLGVDEVTHTDTCI